MKKKFGIDKISFYIPQYKLDQKVLAQERGIPIEKIEKGLGQTSMSVIPPWEDVITMGVSAAKKMLTPAELDEIDCVLFATETGVDYSKAGSVIIHELLGLQKKCRAVEIKQACYAGTFALQTALSFLSSRIHKNILVVCSDVARYGFNTPGESSQGAGAVAMLVKEQPRLAAVNTNAAYLTSHVYDFWRPHGRSEAVVDGKFSCQVYLEMLQDVFMQYRQLNPLKKLYSMCFHLPVPRLVEKAYKQMSNFMTETSGEPLKQQLDYGKLIGNCYTGSLYLGLMSLLENSSVDLSGQSIGMYSYGSGATCDFFDIEIQPEYKDVLDTQWHRDLINQRMSLSMQEYELFYSHFDKGVIDGGYGFCALKEVSNFKRHYSLRESVHFESADNLARAEA